jgi:chromosome segregation ATPase
LHELYNNSSECNKRLTTNNKQISLENIELKKENRIHKRVSDELVNDINVLENLIKTKNDLLNSKNDEIYELKKQIEDLSKENNKLKSIIAKDVENSSIPSSVNVYKKKISNSRTKSDKLKGGQTGHKGHSLEYLETTSVTTINHEKLCPKCGTELTTISEKKKQLVQYSNWNRNISITKPLGP